MERIVCTARWDDSHSHISLQETDSARTWTMINPKRFLTSTYCIVRVKSRTFNGISQFLNG